MAPTPFLLALRAPRPCHRPALLKLIGALTAVVLSACSALPSPPEAMHDGPMARTQRVLSPNPQLHVEGIPPVPLSLVDEVARYTEFQGHGLVDWHPLRREMLVSHRAPGGSTPQLWRLTAPGAAPLALTRSRAPVTFARYEPGEGAYLVYQQAEGGSEVTQLHRLDLATGASTLLTDPSERHAMNLWLRRPGQPTRLVSSSLPLDRTATGGTRAEVRTRLWLTDPLHPEQRQLLAELPGGGWAAHAVSPDGQQLALQRYLSANASEIWRLDLPAPGAPPATPHRLLPADGDTLTASHQPVAWQPDGQGLLLVSDRASEFQELMRLDLRTGQLQRVTAHIPWNVQVAAASPDGRRLALVANEDGQRTLHLMDGATLKVLDMPRHPPGAVVGVALHPRTGELAVALSSHTGPGQIWTVDTDGAAAAEAWTQPRAAAGLDTRQFSRQQVVRWPSFDGRTISGLITRPGPRHPGRRPVFIHIHGGPEGQAQTGFLGRYHYFVEELGVAVLQPNVRGSAGYGKRFLALDNGLHREDAVRDISALLDWIATQPDLDPQRVLVAGGSYGGYMSLAVAAHEADRIAGAIDVVGISHFVTFLQNTESYRRDLRRAEYGDERDPAMREFLDRISPLTQAHRMRKPLFIVQGRNDPRVPWTEAEQMVARARAQGTPVWYLRAENEGHGFARKENADFEFYATVLFMRQTLLK